MKTRKINYRKAVIFGMLIIFAFCLLGLLVINGKRHAEKVALQREAKQKIERLEIKDVPK